MKIVKCDDIKVDFKEIEENAVFEWFCKYYIKTKEGNYSNTKFNCWNLTNSVYAHFTPKQKVIPHPNAELIVK